MASPPFAPATTSPQDNDIVSQFPADERTYRDVASSMFGVDHDVPTGGHGKLSMIAQGATPSISGTLTAIWSLIDGRILSLFAGSGAGSAAVEEFGVPVGCIIPTFRLTAPGGYLLCFGQNVSRTTYARLWTLLGSPNTGDGVTSFTLPDLRGRTLFGKDDMGGSAAGNLTTAGGGLDGATLGASGGAQNKSVLQANLPAANLTISGITIAAPTGTAPIQQIAAGVGAGAVPLMIAGSTTALSISAPAVSSQGTAALGGSGTALQVVPPALVCNWAIKF